MAVIDSSWLVALLDPRNARHEATKQALSEATQVIVSPVVLAETLWVLERGQPEGTRKERRMRAAEAVSAFLATSSVRIRDSPDAAGALALVKKSPSLSFPDAVAITVARALRRPLWTFDVHQKAAFDAL